MPVKRKTGPQGRCDALCGALVRSRGACERCGKTTGLQWAHIVKRNYAHTRTDETNAWCLCGTCHYEVDNFADQFMALVIRTIGRTEYERLVRKAKDGVRIKFDWKAELIRLKAKRAGEAA